MALKPNAGLIAPVPGVPQTEPPKFNLGDLFCAKPPWSVAWLIGAVGPSERAVGRGAGVHIAARLRFGRSDRRRCLGGSSSGCRSGRPRRRGKCRRNNRRAHRRTRRHAWRRTWHQRRWLREGCLQRRSRRGCEACRGIDHGRHWGRKPVEPQQHTAKSNHQHGTIDSQPHRFTLGVILPRAPSAGLSDRSLVPQANLARRAFEE
jgi:hypothetical protein